MSAHLLRGRKRALLPACALLTLAVAVAAVGAPERALAQAGAPTPGWAPQAAGGLRSNRERCSLKTLRGSYLFTATGFNIVEGVAQPKAIIEAIEFNGDGALDVPAATVSINGVITRSANGVGAYTLDAECRGTLTFLPGPSFDIFADDNGKQLWMIQTGPNTAVFQGTVTRVSH